MKIPKMLVSFAVAIMSFAIFGSAYAGNDVKTDAAVNSTSNSSMQYSCQQNGGSICTVSNEKPPACDSSKGGSCLITVTPSPSGAQSVSLCQSFFLGNGSCGVIVGPVFSASGGLITSATKVNNIVRVSASQSTNVSAFGEVHNLAWSINRHRNSIVYGPFIAVGGVSSNGFAVATGVMFGLNKTGSTVNRNNAPITVSLGVVFTPGAQKLGDGLHANQPLPMGETDVRYKTITATGLMLAVGSHF